MSVTVSGGWIKLLDELQSFILANPRLEVEPTCLCIPEDLRIEFFRLFDTVQLGFIESEHAELVQHAGQLSSSYMDIEEHLVNSLCLSGVNLPDNLKLFLHNPARALSTYIRNPLFDLIQKKTDPASFREAAKNLVERNYHTLYYSGYIKWVVLSLVQKMMPDEVYEVSISSLMEQDAIFHDRYEKREVPSPATARRIAFVNEVFVTFLVPDLIAHAPGVSRFIAFKAQPGKPISPAKEVSDDREWLTPPALLELKSDLLVYTDSQLKNLALVADSRRFNRPDMLVHFVNAGQATLSDLHTVTELSTTLRPIEGTFVLPVNSSPVPAENLHKLSMQPAGSAVQPADSSANQPAETTVLDVNLDDSLLEPLVNKLLHNSTTGQYDEPQSDVKTEGT